MDLKKTLAKINEGREKIEACFVFACWSDPELYEDYKTVNVGKDETLKNEDAQFYWILGMNMYQQGIRKFDHISIEAFLSNNKKIKAKFEAYGGYQTVKELQDLVNPDNVSGYFDKIARMNSLSVMAEKSEELFTNVDRFQNATNEDIYDAFELLNNSVSLQTGHDSKIEDLKITQEYIDECQSGENVGLNYGENAPLLNYITLGVPLSDVYLFAAHSGAGKALAITEPVLTPTGFVPMGDIKVGDYVIGEDGKKTRVIGVFPQGKRQAYKVTFGDGTEVICDRDHLWKSKYLQDEIRGNDWKPRTTGEMYDRGVINSQGQRKFRVPICSPITEFVPKNNLIIPPYTLGALIGDGYICRREIQFTTTEQDIVDRINNEIGDVGFFKQHEHNKIQYIYCTKLTRGNSWLSQALKTLGLYGCKSGDKFIPFEYLYASYEDRLALAQGLMDTDGSVDAKGHLTYSTTSYKLAQDVMFLLRSLGKQVRIHTLDRREQGKNIEYEVYVCGLNEELFSSKKHQIRYDNKQNKDKAYYYDQMRIESIEELDEKVEMQCIMVDNDTHTYLCRNFIVTHNTSFIFENMVLPISKTTPVAIFSNEMKISAYQNMLMAHILTTDLDYWKLTRKKIKIGKYTDEDLEMIAKAKEISETKYNNIKFVKVFENDTDTMCKFIKKLAHMGIRYVVWDTMKGDDIVDGSDAWYQLLMNSRKIFNLVSKLGIAMTCTFQLALYTTNQRYLDASCLSSSKQIKEVVSELIMMRKLWADEYTDEKYDCKAFKYKKDSKMIKEMIKLDKEKTYYVCFVNKTRNDEGDRQVLYEWKSAWNRWYEVGYCNIRNDHRNVG